METINGLKLSLNFNLRNKKSSKTTQIYAIVKLNDKQVKLSFGLKVYPYQWDALRQECKVMPNVIESERANCLKNNILLYRVKCKFQEIIDYLCRIGAFNVSDIEKYIKRTLQVYPMANKNAIPPKRTTTATKLIKEAFDEYYSTNGNQKDSTIHAQKNRLNKFLHYLKETDKGDSPKRLTQDGLNEYKEWLTANADKGNRKLSAKTINQHCQLIARLINDELAAKTKYSKYHFQVVRYVCLADTRRKEDRYKRGLTDEEVNTFLSYEPQNEKEKEVQDLFQLQLQTGVRKGDLVRLVNGEYTTSKDEPDYIIIKTQKEGITAVCEKKYIEDFNVKYPSGLQIDIKSKSFENTYNRTLKKIFKQCGLDTIIKYQKNTAGRIDDKESRLYELISNHFARHTFITNKLREGMTPDKLCYMTGHADERMIREVYAHLTEEDKIQKVKKEQERIGQIKSNVTEHTIRDEDIITRYGEIMNQKRNMLIDEILKPQHRQNKLNTDSEVIFEYFAESAYRNCKELKQLREQLMQATNGDKRKVRDLFNELLDFEEDMEKALQDYGMSDVYDIE